MGAGAMQGMCSKHDFKLIGQSRDRRLRLRHRRQHDALEVDDGARRQQRVPHRDRHDLRPAVHGTDADEDGDRRARNVGPCKPGQRPGDIVMPNGQTMNMRDVMNGRRAAAVRRRASITGTRHGTQPVRHAEGIPARLRRDRPLLLAAGARAGGHRQRLAPAGVDAHRARERAAQLRRQEGHRGARARSSPTGSRTRRAPTRSRSSSRASCCRTSPACRCWPTSPRCATSPRDLGKRPEADRAAGAGRPRRRPLGA